MPALYSQYTALVAPSRWCPIERVLKNTRGASFLYPFDLDGYFPMSFGACPGLDIFAVARKSATIFS